MKALFPCYSLLFGCMRMSCFLISYRITFHFCRSPIHYLLYFSILSLDERLDTQTIYETEICERKKRSKLYFMMSATANENRWVGSEQEKIQSNDINHQCHQRCVAVRRYQSKYKIPIYLESCLRVYYAHLKRIKYSFNLLTCESFLPIMHLNLLDAKLNARML